MHKRVAVIRRLLCLLVMCIFTSIITFAQSDEGSYPYEKIVRENLKQMTAISGTFDLYDSKQDQVRNLRLIEILPDVKKKDGVAKVPARFRDVNTGDFVIVEVTIHEIAKNRYDSKWSIVDVEKLQKDVEKREDYSNEEIIHTMKDYVAQQAKFTGHLMLFDPKHEKMRKLKLIEINEDVRRYGILSIATSKFRDIESAETLIIDVKVKNNDGVLEVDSLKIKKVRSN